MNDNILSREELKIFLEKEKIEIPKIISRRNSRDVLTESINEFSKFSVMKFNIEQIKMVIFENNKIVDEEDYNCKKNLLLEKIDSSTQVREEIKKDFYSRKELFCEVLEEIESFNNRNLNINNLKRIGQNYLDARINASKVTFPYNIRTEWLLKKYEELLDLCKYAESPQELRQEAFLVLTPEKDTLELAREKKLEDLVKEYKANKRTKKFKNKFEDFYTNFFNLDYINLSKPPKTRDDLEKEIGDMAEIKTIKKEVQTIKERTFLIHFFYSLPEGRRYDLVEEISNYIEELSEVQYVDSWDRQIWTRLQLTIYPILIKLEEKAIKKKIRKEGYKIANNSYRDLQEILERI